MRLPNLLVNGAAKSGTTALYHYLGPQPEIFLSRIEETRFFAFEGEKLDFRGPGDDQFQREIVANIDDYCDLFEKAQNENQ